jgi:hypothetical protein
MKKRYIVMVAIGVSLLSIGLSLYFVLRPQKPDIIRQTQKKVGFTIFAPSRDDKTWLLNKESIEYDTTVGVLTLHIQQGSNSIVITEQATPEPFTDIPNYSSIFLGKLNEYKELTVSLGTISLTHPTELKGSQSAVMNVRGTLMFLHPTTDLSDNEWKSVFNSLQTL